jgi:hypothetical protein
MNLKFTMASQQLVTLKLAYFDEVRYISQVRQSNFITLVDNDLTNKRSRMLENDKIGTYAIYDCINASDNGKNMLNYNLTHRQRAPNNSS